MTKPKKFEKNGSEITELYKQMTKDGITPEDGMLFLLAYMEKSKAESIGMDITGEDGHTFCLTININDGAIDDQPSPEAPIKISKTSPSAVT